MEKCNLHRLEYLGLALPQFCKLPVSGLTGLTKLWSTYLPHTHYVMETFQQLIKVTVVRNDYDEDNDDETVEAATQCLKVAFYASIQGSEMGVENNEEDEDNLAYDELTLHKLLGDEQFRSPLQCSPGWGTNPSPLTRSMQRSHHQ